MTREKHRWYPWIPCSDTGIIKSITIKPPNGNEIAAEILVRVSREVPNVFLYRNNRVSAMAVGAGGRLRRVDAGIDGQSDLSGLISPSGRRIECEIKADYVRGHDRQSPVQEAFERRISGMGGIYILITGIGWTTEGRVRPDVTEVIERLKHLN